MGSSSSSSASIPKVAVSQPLKRYSSRGKYDTKDLTTSTSHKGDAAIKEFMRSFSWKLKSGEVWKMMRRDV
jgi:hypothetical protein